MFSRKGVNTILQNTKSIICRPFSSSFLPKAKPSVCWLDLNGSGLSAIERLCLEEALLRHDPLKRSWAVVGTHDPIYSSRLKLKKYLRCKRSDTSRNNNNNNVNQNCIIIMGIGGKPESLLNVQKVQDDNVVVIKRFSGGGTVVVDHSSLWTTFIGRPHDFPHVQPYPKDIMKWSADEVFSDVFERFQKEGGSGALSRCGYQGGKGMKTLIMDTKSCGLASMNHNETNNVMKISKMNETMKDPNHTYDFPVFNLRENDYVLGEHKMGGNAQSITNGGWLHHTSFLWDYDNYNMEYLSLPSKRPDYRGDRHHDDFLVKLKSIYGGNCTDLDGKRLFFQHLKQTSKDAFDLEEVSLGEALHVIENELGGFQAWFEKCRTKIIEV